MRTIRPSSGRARTIRTTAVLAVALASAACGWSNKSKGAVIGTTAGAAAGGVIGNQTGSTARGAIIGAVVGGAAGTIIGHQMDDQAEELTYEIPGAVVERVGEGIQVTFASGLLFDFDSDAIRAGSATNLRALAASLQKYPNTHVLIVGHTDSVGTTDYNQGLSTRRANSAARYLTTQGVAADRTETSGRGELEPLATNESEAGRQANRRIEVAIFASEAARHATR
jgi:outer membrane protein OmpA-like peptidoglycan-associated protein